MKRSFKMLAAAMFAAAALFTGTALQAQDAPPAGGFKNAFLNMGKSGKVSLTYTLWNDQVGKRSYTLAFGDQRLNFWIVRIIVFGGRNTSDGLILEGEILNSVSSLNGSIGAELIEDISHHLLEVLAVLDFIIVRIFLWQDFIEEDAAKGSIALLPFRMNANWGLQLDKAHIIGKLSFVNAGVSLTFGLSRRLLVGEIVAT